MKPIARRGVVSPIGDLISFAHSTHEHFGVAMCGREMIFITSDGNACVEMKFVFAFRATKITMDGAFRHVIFSRVDDLQLGQNPKRVNKKKWPVETGRTAGERKMICQRLSITVILLQNNGYVTRAE